MWGEGGCDLIKKQGGGGGCRISLLLDCFPSNTPADLRCHGRKRLRYKCAKPPTTPLLAILTLNGNLRGVYGTFCTCVPHVYSTTRAHSTPQACQDLSTQNWRTIYAGRNVTQVGPKFSPCTQFICTLHSHPHSHSIHTSFHCGVLQGQCKSVSFLEMETYIFFCGFLTFWYLGFLNEMALISTEIHKMRPTFT